MPRHHLPDGAVVVLAATLVVSTWLGLLAGLCMAAACWLARGGTPMVGLCVLLAVAGSIRGDRAWDDAQPRHLGDYTGWAELAADPAPFGSGLRVTFEVEAERFDAWVYGQHRHTLAERQAGEYVWLVGRRDALAGGQVRRAAVRHVVGRLEVQVVGDVIDGSALSRASNRVRRTLRSVAEATMPGDEAALFTGLVIGDDARQPAEVVAEFRAAGLTHLTAVSGQNVAFLLAAAAPLLQRCRPWWRWAATCGLIGWFMALTRFEPSVLRAGVMAILAVTAFTLGRQVRPVRLLALALIALVLVDPLLVWSVGFWLSVGATAGVCVVGPWLLPHLPGPLWLRAPLAVTVGAQVGVAAPSLLVFGRLPVVSVVANLVAVPVAGFVMLYGIPAALGAALLPEPVAVLVMAPATLGTRWVATVARVAAAVEPAGGAAVASWVLLLLAGGVTAWRRSTRRTSRRSPRRWRRAAGGVPI